MGALQPSADAQASAVHQLLYSQSGAQQAQPAWLGGSPALRPAQHPPSIKHCSCAPWGQGWGHCLMAAGLPQKLPTTAVPEGAAEPPYNVCTPSAAPSRTHWGHPTAVGLGRGGPAPRGPPVLGARSGQRKDVPRAPVLPWAPLVRGGPGAPLRGGARCAAFPSAGCAHLCQVQLRPTSLCTQVLPALRQPWLRGAPILLIP